MPKHVVRRLPWLLPALLLIISAACSQSDATTPSTSHTSTTGAQPLPSSKQDLMPVSEFLKVNKGVVVFSAQGLSDLSSYLKMLGIRPSSLENSPLAYTTPPTIEADPSLRPSASEKDLNASGTHITTIGAFIEKVYLRAKSVDVYIVPKDDTFQVFEVRLNQYRNGEVIPVHFIITNEVVVEKVPRRD